MFFVVSGLILGVAIYSQAPLLFWAFGLMVGSLVVSLIFSWMMLHKMTISRVPPTHGVAGEPMVIRYQLNNLKRLIPAFGVVINENWGRGKNGWRKTGPLALTPPRLKGHPMGWVVHIGPGQHIQAEAPCWPLRRGYLSLQKIQISTAFPFGIIRRVREFELPADVLVYPKLVRIDRHILFKLSDMDPFGRERIERGGGHEEFFGMREYRPGDSLKMIDWKRSARTGQMITREMTQPSPPKIMVALDLTGLPTTAGASLRPDEQEKHDNAIEHAVSLTASLVCDAYFHGYQIGLVVLGVPFTPFPVHHSLPHRTKMLEALAQLDTSERTSKKQALPARPSVIIRAGETVDADKNQAAADQTIFDASKYKDYAVELTDGAGSILDGRSVPRSRRQQIRESL